MQYLKLAAGQQALNEFNMPLRPWIAIIVFGRRHEQAIEAIFLTSCCCCHRHRYSVVADAPVVLQLLLLLLL